MTETPLPEVEIVEVGPRDGFQSIGPFIPTERKIALVEMLVGAGLRRIEIGSFVSPSAVPQMRDTPDLVAACRAFPGLRAQVLVPNERWGMAALAAGARDLAFVLSVSESHNRSNVRRSPAESAAEYRRLVAALPPGATMRLNLAAAFHCPFDGLVPAERTLALLDELVPAMPEAEICPCDTTGRADPRKVTHLFTRARDRFPASRSWAYHAHDTYGMGVATAVAAFGAGVRVLDAAFAGLGGCPFAPGATGNVATEDLAFLFGSMGVATGIDLSRLLAAARQAATLPGGSPGGRVRLALDGAERPRS